MTEYTIKDIPKGERPRERLIKHGPSSLSNAELLAIILRTGMKGENVLTLSGNILNKYDINKLSKLDISNLKNIKGISDAKACQIVACFELGRRVSVYRGEQKPIIRSSEEAYSLVSDMSSEPLEVFAVLLLNIRNRVINLNSFHLGNTLKPNTLSSSATFLGTSDMISLSPSLIIYTFANSSSTSRGESLCSKSFFLITNSILQ